LILKKDSEGCAIDLRAPETFANHGATFPVIGAQPGIHNGLARIDRDLVGNDSMPGINTTACPMTTL